MSHSSSPSPTRKQLREFGLLIGIVFPVLLGWLLPALHGHAFRLWTLWIGLPALCLGLIAPRSLRWPYQGWMALGHGLGWINGHIVLGAVFLLVLQPIAFIMRLFGYDPLRRRQGSQVSYREKRQHPSTNMTRIF